MLEYEKNKMSRKDQGTQYDRADIEQLSLQSEESKHEEQIDSTQIAVKV